MGENQLQDAPEPKPHRRADIQGLRAVAVVMVVAYHAGLPPSGGFIGVDVFFVISGFVVGGVLLRELGRGSGLGFAAFYSRRVRRLLPALALTSTVVAVLGVLLLSPLTTQKATGRTGIAASLFAANIQLANVPSAGYFGTASTKNAMLHTWSLSVEEQFYLGFPALLAVLWWFASRGVQKRTRLGVVIGLLSVLALVSFALSVVTTYRPSERLGTTFAFYMAPSRAWEFAAGVLLALVAHRLTRIPGVLAVVIGALGAAVLCAAALVLDEGTEFPGLAALAPVVGTVLLIVAGTSTDRGASRLLGVRPAVWIGDVSYGWYLWHWPLIVFAAELWPNQGWALVVAGLGSLIPTVLSSRYVENPIRFSPRAATRSVFPLLAVCVLVPIAAFSGLLAVSRVQARSDTVERFAEEIRPHEDASSGCEGQRALTERDEAACTWTVDDPKGSVYLVGDSNAGHFTEPVVEAAEAAGYDVTVATANACPFADVVRATEERFFDGEDCHDDVMATVDELVRRKPSLVIIGTSSVALVQDGAEVLVDPESGEQATDVEARAARYEAGLRSVVERLTAAGVPTVVVQAVPQFSETLGAGWRAENCPAVSIYLDRCGGSRSLASVEDVQRAARAAERDAVEDSELTTLLDPNDLLCEDGRCSTSRGEQRLYRDAKHVSVDGALLFTPRFTEIIEEQAVPRDEAS